MSYLYTGRPERAPQNNAPLGASRPVRSSAPMPINQALADWGPADAFGLPPVEAAPLMAQRSPEDAGVEGAMAATVPEGRRSAVPGLLVDDGAGEDGAHMSRERFMRRLSFAVYHAAEGALAGTQFNARECPWIPYWIGRYRYRPAEDIERAIHLYAPEAANAGSADEYIALIAGRVRTGILAWLRSGELKDVPDVAEVPEENRFEAGEKPIQRMGEHGQTGVETGDPAAIRRGLGAGAPLDGGVRSRLEGAMGADLSHVRIHTDGHAAAMAGGLRAKAFTVGEHVAFGSGQFRPGTLHGDGLLAHEAAHTLQQSGGDGSVSSGRYNELEEDAERSTAGVLMRMWGGVKGAAGALRERVGPALRSGLSLQRCGEDRPHERDKIDDQIGDGREFRADATEMILRLSETPELASAYTLWMWYQDMASQSVTTMQPFGSGSGWGGDGTRSLGWAKVASDQYEKFESMFPTGGYASSSDYLRESAWFRQDFFPRLAQKVGFELLSASQMELDRELSRYGESGEVTRLFEDLSALRLRTESDPKNYLLYLAIRYPVLKAFIDDSDTLASISSSQELSKALADVLSDRLANVRKVREALADTDSVWSFDLLLGFTYQRLGVTSKALQDIIQYQAAEVRKAKFLTGLVAPLLLSLPFALSGVGTSVALARVGAIGAAILDGYLLAQAVDEYMIQRAAKRTDLDEMASLVSSDPSVIPIIISILGFGFSAASVWRAFRPVAAFVHIAGEAMSKDARIVEAIIRLNDNAAGLGNACTRYGAIRVEKTASAVLKNPELMKFVASRGERGFCALLENGDDIVKARQSLQELVLPAAPLVKQLGAVPSASEVFRRIGSFAGMSVRDVVAALKRHGFRNLGRTAGGYMKFYGPGPKSSRMEIHIRPNGEVIRVQHTQGGTIRYDADGNVTSSHSLGEFIGGNFIQNR